MALSQLVRQGKWYGDFVVSDAGYRSYDPIMVPQGSGALEPGTLLDAGNAAAAAGNAAKILMGDPSGGGAVDPTAGPVQALAMTRDAEVNDAYLIYGELDRAAVNASLAAHGIIVRQGVLAEAIVTSPMSPGQPNAVAAVASAAPVPAAPSGPPASPERQPGGPSRR